MSQRSGWRDKCHLTVMSGQGRSVPHCVWRPIPAWCRPVRGRSHCRERLPRVRTTRPLAKFVHLWVTATKRFGSGRRDMASKAEKIVAGLGGIDNIDEIEGCITRLRTEVHDASLVNEAALKAAGAHGVVKMGTAIQVVIGTDADPIAAEIEDMM